MEKEKLECEQFEERIKNKTEEELKQEIIDLVKNALGDKEEISSKEFTKMLELHLIMIYSDNNFYEIEYLGRQAIVEHYSYEEFVIRRKK